jgi:hypothetical protein
MKNLLILTFLFLFVLRHSAKHLCMNLQKAIETKKVEVVFKSLGTYKGFCMAMRIKNLSPDTLFVLVEAGRRLNSLVDKNQDILIVKEEIIVLTRKEIKDIVIKGYCCQASNRCPDKGAGYDVNKMADSNLVKVARFVNIHAYGEEIEQEAVWAISDKYSVATVSSANDSLLKPVREMIASITGEELPWYTLITKKYVYAGGVILIVPTTLRGQLQYSNDKENYATLSVLNEKGMQVCQVKNEWLKAGANLNYNLELPIKGLAKGKYRVELKTSEKQLAKREFEI